jgi:DNA-binding MarR family transcriptional regulator
MHGLSTRYADLVAFSPTDEEAVWFAVLGIREMAVVGMERELSTLHDLSLASLVILLALAKHGDQLTVGELSPMVAVVSRSQVSRLVDALDERGLVARSSDDIDGRIRRVSLTPAGRKLLTAARRTAGQASSQALDRLSNTDRDAMRRIWAKLDPTV